MASIYRDLAAKASVALLPHRRAISTYSGAAPLAQEKNEVNGTINVIGDSLSDAGKKNGKYKKKIFGLIPYRWFLHQSPEDQFTNGRVWTYPLQLRMQHQLQEISTRNPLYNIRSHSMGVNRIGKNVAEGGSTAYNYRRIINFFRRIKGFILSFFLNNIEKQSHDIKKQDQGIKPHDLNLIFAGANDFVTVGYCNEGGVSRAIKGIQTSIDLLTTEQQKTGRSNYSKNAVLFTLPDFSKTPRFQGETEEKKAQAQSMSLKFNDELKDLARSYRYIDFRFCDIYQIESKDKIDAILAKVKQQGIVVVGKGSHRTVYFVEKGELILQPPKDEPVAVKVNLSKEQQKMLGAKLEKRAPRKLNRNEGNRAFLNQWAYEWPSQEEEEKIGLVLIDQPVPFKFYDIYQVEKKEDINFLSEIDEKGIIFVGTGSNRDIYFIENGKFVLQSLNQPLVHPLTLSKNQQKMLEIKPEELDPHKLQRNAENTMFLDEWVCQLASHAKLDMDIKVFDTAAVFNKVNENPEMYGFTSGCAIYYRFNKCESHIKGNAIVLTKTMDNEIEALFFQQGELVTHEGKARKVKLKLSTELRKQLDSNVGNQATGMLELVGLEQKHSTWHTRIIQAAVKGYQDSFGQKIKLADIYTSILLQMKKHLPNQSRIFWDDLHPTATMHFLLELVFGEFFNNHYKLHSPRQWLDDTAIFQRKEDAVELPFKSREAPESLTLGLNNKKAKLATFSQSGIVGASGLVKKNDDGSAARLLSADQGYYCASRLKPYSRYHLLKAATPHTEEKVSDEPKKVVQFNC